MLAPVPLQSDCGTSVAVTKEIILDNTAIQKNRNIPAKILIALPQAYQNCSREIYIPLDCFVVNDYFLQSL